MRHDTTLCLTWLLPMCAMAYLCVCHDWLVCVSHQFWMCAMPHWYVWLDACICLPACVIWFIRICAIARSYMCNGSFVYAPWLIGVCAVTYLGGGREGAGRQNSMAVDAMLRTIYGRPTQKTRERERRREWVRVALSSDSRTFSPESQNFMALDAINWMALHAMPPAICRCEGKRVRERQHVCVWEWGFHANITAHTQMSHDTHWARSRARRCRYNKLPPYDRKGTNKAPIAVLCAPEGLYSGVKNITIS